jgi:hypothetical protein
MINRAKCRKCGYVVESKHRHDYAQCKCGAIAVDGGKDYIRRIGNPDDFIEVVDEEISPNEVCNF